MCVKGRGATNTKAPEQEQRREESGMAIKKKGTQREETSARGQAATLVFPSRVTGDLRQGVTSDQVAIPREGHCRQPCRAETSRRQQFQFSFPAHQLPGQG